MMNCLFRKTGKTAALAAGAALLLLAMISCSTVHRTVVQLPNVPGATYIGSEQCDTCHDDLYKDFATADHARLMARGTNALDAGCESCHGPCSTSRGFRRRRKAALHLHRRTRTPEQLRRAADG